jgi:hypothetical protein
MKTSVKLNSFVQQFVAVLKGDDAKALGQKVFRQADSAIQSEIAALKGDLIKLEDDVTEAKEAEASATINKTEVITSRGTYVKNLYAAANAVTLAEDTLKAHKEKIAFLEAKLAAISKIVLESEVEA